MALVKGATYEGVSSENYDGFLRASGISSMQSKVAAKITPSMIWTEENGKWKQKTKTAFKTITIEFNLGEEFDEELVDGRKCKSVVTIEGNTLTHKQNLGEIKSVVTREFNGDEMISTFQIGDVTAKRVFKKK